MKSPLAHHPLVWDAAIAVVLALGLGIAAGSAWLLSYKEFSVIFRLILGLFGFLLTFYGSFIEPKRI